MVLRSRLVRIILLIATGPLCLTCTRPASRLQRRWQPAPYPLPYYSRYRCDIDRLPLGFSVLASRTHSSTLKVVYSPINPLTPAQSMFLSPRLYSRVLAGIRPHRYHHPAHIHRSRTRSCAYNRFFRSLSSALCIHRIGC